MPIFRVKSVNIYTGQKNFTQTPSVVSVTNIRYVFMLSVSSWISWWCPQVVQQNGNEDNLKDGPKVSWLGYSLLPEGKFCLVLLGFSYSNFIWGVFSKIWFPGTEIEFPLLFTEDLTFDLEPFLFLSDKGLGTMPAENTCVGSTTELIAIKTRTWAFF